MTDIRASNAGDEAGIRRLFETCHKRPLDHDLWSWRYASRPHGAPVVDLAVDGGEIVGHVGTLPVRLEQGAQALKAGLWVDLMIEPKHRNLTLFLDMAESNRRHCAGHGVEVLFAFPNDKSFPVLKRMLGWRDAGDILALEGALSSLTKTAGANTAPVGIFGAEFDALWALLRPKDRFCGARGAEQLNWRYRGRPRSDYRAWVSRGPAGFIVVKTFDAPPGRVGDILDFWAEPGAEAGLLSAALDYFERENVATVSAWALEGTPQRAALEACGLAPKADRTHFAGRWTAEAGPEFPARHAAWALSKGDSDIF